MDIEQHLEQLAVDLDLAARQARERMQKSDHLNLSTFGAQIEHRKWLNTLLREMVFVIDHTARSNGARPEQRLYVWPGYDSILLDGVRVTFEVDRDVRHLLSTFGYDGGMVNDESGRAMQTGVIFPPSENGIDRTTLYFDAALAGLGSSMQDPENTFSVGGTHNWLASNPTVGPHPLIGFEVRTSGRSTTGHRAFPTIVVDPAQPLDWGESLAETINGMSGESPRSFWPLPIRRFGEPLAAYQDRLEIEHGSEHHRSIRHRLYSLWLIGCFAEDPGALLLDGRGPRWLQRLIEDLDEVEPERASRIRGLAELERNVASGATLTLDPSRFTTWGVLTLPYPVADSRSCEDGIEADDLGSGMLLSNFDLPGWYYFTIRQWIASYYLSLRQQESSVLRAEREAHKAALHAERELRRQLSHAVGTELTYVAYLASISGESIAAQLFEPRKGILQAAVTFRRQAAIGSATDDESAFGDKKGIPTPLETALVDIILKTSGDDQLSRDVAIIEAALAAVPAEEGRSTIAALATEVSRVTSENRALVRVDDPTVVAEIQRTRGKPSDANAMLLVDLLGRAVTVALTVYFRKAFPPHNERPEEVCLLSADALFGGAELDEVRRREVAQECAIHWRDFLATSYRKNKGQGPSYQTVKSWLQTNLPGRSQLRFALPASSDAARLAPGGGDYAPLVIEAWLTEALLNSLKHSRPAKSSSEALLRVDWLTADAHLSVSNTTTSDRAEEVNAAVAAAAAGGSTIKEGHQGLAFLAYAARHLFPGKQLHSQVDAKNSMLHLFVK